MNLAIPKDGSLPEFLDRRAFIWSYSALDQFRKCPYKFYRQYLVRDQPYIETPERKRGNDIHAAFARTIATGVPLPDNMRQWAPFVKPLEKAGALSEIKLGITSEGKPTGFWDKNAWGRGTADVVLVRGDTAFIPDWKHVNKAREEPFELEVLAVLVHARNPHLKKIKGQYAWLRENRMGEMHDLSDTTRTWNTIREIVAEINVLQKTLAFEKHRSPLCGWCPIRECEHWFEARK